MFGFLRRRRPQPRHAVSVSVPPPTPPRHPAISATPPPLRRSRMKVLLTDGSEAPIPDDPELERRIAYLAHQILPPPPPS